MQTWKKLKSIVKSGHHLALRVADFHLRAEKRSNVSACGGQRTKYSDYYIYSMKNRRPLGRRFFLGAKSIGTLKTFKKTLAAGLVCSDVCPAPVQAYTRIL